MNGAPSTEPLNIELACVQFKACKPVNLHGGDVSAVPPHARKAALRLTLLKEALSTLHRERPAMARRVEEAIQSGRETVDAIYLGMMQVIDNALSRTLG